MEFILLKFGVLRNVTNFGPVQGNSYVFRVLNVLMPTSLPRPRHTKICHFLDDAFLALEHYGISEIKKNLNSMYLSKLVIDMDYY